MKPTQPQTWRVGPLTVSGPERRVAHGAMDPQWVVLAIDSVTEELVEKVFPTVKKAKAFIETLVSGHPPIDPLADDPDGPAKTSQLRTPPVVPGAPPTLNGHHVRINRQAGETLATHGASAPFNISAVADALVAEELDPFVEIARAVKDERPVLRNGAPVIGPDGQPVMERVIGSLDRAKILVDLGQYLQPKLKAVEVKLEDKRKLTTEQLDERIAAIMGRAAAEAAHQAPSEDAGQ